MLAKVAVVAAQHLLAMRLIIGSIQVQDDDAGPPTPSADERLDEVIVADRDPLALCFLLLEHHRPLFGRQLGIATRIGMMESR